MLSSEGQTKSRQTADQGKFLLALNKDWGKICISRKTCIGLNVGQYARRAGQTDWLSEFLRSSKTVSMIKMSKHPLEFTGCKVLFIEFTNTWYCSCIKDT